jgi:hypothetical protein
MTQPAYTKSAVCRMFNIPVERLNQQYAANAATFKTMYDKAVKTGKKVNGYTADQLKKLYDQYTQLSK